MDTLTASQTNRPSVDTKFGSEVNQVEQIEEARTSVSEEVRGFYEKMPYPAPLSSLDEHLDLYRNRDRRRALSHRTWPAGQPLANLEILIAGCGTSQAARYALREPDAIVTAIDVSETSLGHTRDLQS